MWFLRRALLVMGLLCFAVSLARAACSSPAFENPTLLSMLSGPVQLATGDFNGDGVLDLAATESSDGSIGVRLGQPLAGVPSRQFAPRQGYAVGGTPFGIAAADLDADSDLDLVVTNWGLDCVQILLGRGDGTFALVAPTFPAGSRPYELVVADFDHDGVQDIAVADNGEPSVRVLIGTASGPARWDGGFAPAVRYAVSNLSLAIAAGDVNGDGHLDLFATEYSDGTVAELLGTGTGTFLPALHVPGGAEPYDLATGDFNEDGRMDLVVDNAASGGVRIKLGTNTGFFAVDINELAGGNCSGVAVTDFNGDGHQDILVSLSVANGVRELRGVGDGTFTLGAAIGDCCFPVHVVAGDFDSDGRMDAAVCAYQASRVDVFWQMCFVDTRPPVITRIRDVPNDEGGKVFITWTASSLDVVGGVINAYRVWRMVPPGSVAELRVPGEDLVAAPLIRPDGSRAIVYWEALATLPAQRFAGYGFTASTPQDSLPTGNPRFTFKITAATANVDEFYDSAPDSGYSVDNLAPRAPGALSIAYNTSGTQLAWTANAEPDFAGYAVHRSREPDFVASAENQVASVSGTSYQDPVADGSYYRVVAIDRHGNRAASAVLTAGVTGVGEAPLTTGLREPQPNPGRGDVLLRFSLAKQGTLSLAVFDQQGRRVRTLWRGVRAAGTATLAWNGRDDHGQHLPSGIYFAELRADGQRFVRRLVRLD